MSMLDTLGGLAGGMGGSGGVGGSIPSNTSAATASATATINPSVTLGRVGGGAFSIGPFAPMFPGAGETDSSSINPPSGLGLKISTPVILAIIGGLFLVFFVMMKR